MKPKKLLKRIISLVVTMGIMFTTAAVSVSAIDNEGISDKQISEYEIQEMLKRGYTLMKQKGYKQLSIAKYYQNRAGDPWINDIMGKGPDTIRTSGCNLTSFTTLHNYYSGVSDNPGTVNARLGSIVDNFNYRAAANTYGYTYDGAASCECKSYIDCVATIEGFIEQNIPVVVQMKNPKGGYHYVLATGYGGTTVMINDPDIYKNHSELSQYNADGYIMDKIRIFRR